MLHMALCYKTFKIYNFIKIIKNYRFDVLIEAGSHCIALSWPGTRSFDQSGLQLTENHQPLLEIKASATTPSNFHVSELNRLLGPSQWPWTTYKKEWIAVHGGRVPNLSPNLEPQLSVCTPSEQIQLLWLWGEACTRWTTTGPWI